MPVFSMLTKLLKFTYGVNSCPRMYFIRLCHIECRLTVTEKYLSDHVCTQYDDRTINTTKMNELDDFIGKFKRLQQAGKEANLVLSALGRKPLHWSMTI